MERRAFVKSGALALVTIGLSPSFLRRTAFGMELVNAPKGKVLICLFQRGAADALNIVVPHGERAYYAMRPSIAIPQPSNTRPSIVMRSPEVSGVTRLLVKASFQSYLPFEVSP